ncbi:S24 family peptidase [Paucibacter sp. DJ4R-1]|nr:S24 family peptidase [Paucibacter sp. DJ4R-1]
MSQALIRRERLQAWMRKNDLSQADVAHTYGSKVPWVRSILHLNENPAHNRDIGEKAARQLETRLGMPPNHLDGDDKTPARGHPQIMPIGAVYAVPQLVRAKQTVKLDAEHTMPMPVSLLEAAGTRPDSAAWLRLETNEMAPALTQGCSAVVNITDTQPADGKIYALAWRDQLIIRRLHMTPQGYRLSLDANPAAALTMTDSEFRSQVSVAGRIRMIIQNFD